MPAYTPTFREYMSLIKKGDFPAVNLLMGEEPYYLDILTAAFENHVLADEDKDFNMHVFYGNDVDLELMVASARQFPVMASKKLVILKEAQSMQQAKANLDKLEGYVKNPSSSTVFLLVFKGDNLAATSKLMKAATTGEATIFKSPKIRDNKLPGPLKDYIASKGMTIDDKAVSLLCEYIGSPLSKLFGEVDKLIVAKGGADKRITPADIEKNIGISKDFNSFELVSALARRDYEKVIRILLYFENNPKANPTVMTVATIFRFFTQLLIALSLQNKSDASLMKALDVKSPYALTDVKNAMRCYTFRQAAFAIHSIRDFDMQSKGVGSMQNEHELMKELIYKIFTLS